MKIVSVILARGGSKGIPKKNIIMIDSKGVLHPNRKDIEQVKDEWKYKWDMCINSNGEGREGGMAEGVKGTDMLIAASKPGPGTIKPEYVKSTGVFGFNSPSIKPDAIPQSFGFGGTNTSLFNSFFNFVFKRMFNPHPPTTISGISGY